MMDLRYALRSFLRHPGFTLLIVVTLALGIGATTALCSIVYGALLRRLPYGDEARIVAVWQSNLKNGVQREDTSPAIGSTKPGPRRALRLNHEIIEARHAGSQYTIRTIT